MQPPWSTSHISKDAFLPLWSEKLNKSRKFSSKYDCIGRILPVPIIWLSPMLFTGTRPARNLYKLYWRDLHSHKPSTWEAKSMLQHPPIYFLTAWTSMCSRHRHFIWIWVCMLDAMCSYHRPFHGGFAHFDPLEEQRSLFCNATIRKVATTCNN